MSLQARVLAAVAAVAVVLAVAAAAVIHTTRQRLIEQVDAQLSSAAELARRFDFSRGPARPGGGPAPGEAPRQLSSLYVGYVARNARVTTLFRPNLAADTPPPQIPLRAALDAAASGQAFTAGSEGSDLRYRVAAVPDPRRGGVILLALPLDTVDGAVEQLVVVEIVATAAAVLVLLALAWWVVRLGVRPVRRMTAAAGAIAAGDLSHRVPPADPRTEAGALGVALNRMLQRIEMSFRERAESEDRLRQFVADASHELRTPLATIRGYAELYRHGALSTKGELGDAMRRTEEEAVRMGALVDDLLHLARLDQGRPLDRAPVDLGRVAEDAARDARAVAPDRTITTTAAPNAMVMGDEHRLRQVVANVVGNALVHTPPGSPIELNVIREATHAAIEVTDHGPGMPEEVARRAFERFYRADPARTRHGGGSGLGLAIVKATVEAHGGRATIASRDGEGTTVRIELPVDEAQAAAGDDSAERVSALPGSSQVRSRQSQQDRTSEEGATS